MRQSRTKQQQRKFESEVAVVVGFDWINGRPSKARTRLTGFIKHLQSADAIRQSADPETLENVRTGEGKRLNEALNQANDILSHYKGGPAVWLDHEGRLREFFVCNRKRLETDAAYYQETHILNYIFNLLQIGSIQRLRTCRECGKWYYGVTDRQLSCSSTCRQRFYSHNSKFLLKRRDYMRKYRLQETERNERAQSLARRTK